MRLVGLLRAVNVAGHGKLSMEALRRVVTGLGYGDVATFIQSGNVLFDAPAPTGTSAAIESALAKKLRLETRVMVRTSAEMSAIAGGHAFADRTTDLTRLHVVFLAEAPARGAAVDPSRSPGDEARIVGRELHLHLPQGAGKTKLTMSYLERALGTAGTMRNLSTVTKLSALLARG